MNKTKRDHSPILGVGSSRFGLPLHLTEPLPRDDRDRVRHPEWSACSSLLRARREGSLLALTIREIFRYARAKESRACLGDAVATQDDEQDSCHEQQGASKGKVEIEVSPKRVYCIF